MLCAFIMVGTTTIAQKLCMWQINMLSTATMVVSSIRHNELRDITASLLTEVCHNVGIEPCCNPSIVNILNIRHPTRQMIHVLIVASNGVDLAEVLTVMGWT